MFDKIRTLSLLLKQEKERMLKIKDIKGELATKVSHYLIKRINEDILNEISKVAPQLKFNNKFYFGNMEDFKKFLSGKLYGFKTHGCVEEPYRSFRTLEIRCQYCQEKVVPLFDKIDFENDIYKMEIDLVSDNGLYWTINWSIQAKKKDLWKNIDKLFGDQVVKGKDVDHFDMLGRKIKIGDVVCYSTTINNSVYLGTVSKFNDCTMQMTDGTLVQYDINVLVVSDSVVKKNCKYEHKI